MSLPTSSDRGAGCPVLDALPRERLDPLDPPHDYGGIRLTPGIVRVKTPRGSLAWLVTRFDDVRDALLDRRLSSDPRSPGFPTYITGEVAPPPGFFLQADAPDHPRLRRAVTQDFLSSHVDRMRPRMAEIFDEQLDRMLAMKPPVDLVRHLAVPVSARVICELLGTPLEDHARIQALTDIVLDRSSTATQAEAAATDLMAHFDGVIASKERRPSPDLLGRLVQKAAQEGQPSRAELAGLAALLLLSAYDTMALMMALGVVTLLDNAEQLDAFLSDPSLGDALVDELVRYLSINHAGLPRAATEDLSIGGQVVRAGEGVILMINAANRDREAFAAPDRFDICRGERTHLGFGHGLHKCLGLHFARAELSIAFRTLFTRVPSLSMAVPRESLVYRDDMVLYGLRELPVTWKADPSAVGTQAHHNSEDPS